MKEIIITNNPKVVEKYENAVRVDGSFLDVLVQVRDMAHLGYCPINHPLPASIRMFYSPVRSIVVKKYFNEDGIQIIEDSIIQYKNTMGERLPDERNRSDYEVIDERLLQASLDEFHSH